MLVVFMGKVKHAIRSLDFFVVFIWYKLSLEIEFRSLSSLPNQLEKSRPTPVLLWSKNNVPFLECRLVYWQMLNVEIERKEVFSLGAINL